MKFRRRSSARKREKNESYELTVDGDSEQDPLSKAFGSDVSSNGDIWYFGYGPVVHPDVRQRRDVRVSEEQPALLPDHRLTFAFGGAACLVPACGYMVHGVLMKCKTSHDWEKLCKFGAGMYAPRRLEVFPYEMNNAEEGYDPVQTYEDTTPILAYVFVLADYDPEALERPIEKKPQERYLRLIAQGMKKYGVDPTYIQDEIMSCPYVPHPPREEWQRFPASSDKLPHWTLEKYERMCRKTVDDTTIYFILHDYVHKLDKVDKSHPPVQWFAANAHGQPDISFHINTMVINPDIPFAPTQNDLTPIHYEWAEQATWDFCQNADLAPIRIATFGGDAKPRRGSWLNLLDRASS